MTEVPITVDQVKFHPYHNQRDLLDYCKEKGIVVTAYSPFGNGSLIGDTALRRIAEKYDRSMPQVVLEMAADQGTRGHPEVWKPRPHRGQYGRL